MKLTDLVGTLFDERFEILQVLGEGGMGTVFLAEQIELKRKVAIKVLLDTASDEESVARFMREGQVLAKMQHPNIVSVYGFGIVGGQPYLAMEYLQGRSLQKLINEQGISSWEKTAKIMLQLCSAMSYAHGANVIHRDLKPSNIIVLEDSEQIKIIDFGLAGFADNSVNPAQGLTATGLLIGSVMYMSPEQCLGKKSDHRSDIYSAACIFYELLCAEVPFNADSTIGILHKHATEQVGSIFEKRTLKDVPPEIDLVLKKAMAKEPSQRYQSMAHLKEHIEFFLDSSNKELPTELKDMESAARKKAKHSLPVKFAFALLVLLAVAIAAIVFYRSRKPEEISAKAYYHKMEANRKTVSTARQIMASIEEMEKQVFSLRRKSNINAAMAALRGWIEGRKKKGILTPNEELKATIILAGLYADNLEHEQASKLFQDTLLSMEKRKIANDVIRAQLISEKIKYDAWFGHSGTMSESAEYLVSLLKTSKELSRDQRAWTWLAVASAMESAGKYKESLSAAQNAAKVGENPAFQWHADNFAGHIYYRLRQPEKAQLLIKRAYELKKEMELLTSSSDKDLYSMQAMSAAQSGWWQVAAKFLEKFLQSNDLSMSERADAIRTHAEWILNAWGCTTRNQGPHKDRKTRKVEWTDDLKKSEVEFSKAATLAADPKLKRKCLVWLAGTQFGLGKDADAKNSIESALVLNTGENANDVRGYVANEMWIQGSLYSAHGFYTECEAILSKSIELYSGLGLKDQEKRAREELADARSHR